MNPMLNCILLGFIKDIVDWMDFGLWLFSMNVRIEMIVTHLKLTCNFSDRWIFIVLIRGKGILDFFFLFLVSLERENMVVGVGDCLKIRSRVLVEYLPYGRICRVVGYAR